MSAKILKIIIRKILVYNLRPKIVVLFPEIGRVKKFYHSLAHIVECVSEYIFLIPKEEEKKKKNNRNNNNNKSKITRRQKEKKLKEKREYLWKWYTIISFVMSTLNDLIFSWISPGCSYEFIVVYVPREKSQYATTKYEVNTFKNKIKKENQSDKFLFIIFSFISVYLLLQICYHRNICLRHSTWCKHDDFINNSKYILGPGRKYALVFYNKSCF